MTFLCTLCCCVFCKVVVHKMLKCCWNVIFPKCVLVWNVVVFGEMLFPVMPLCFVKCALLNVVVSSVSCFDPKGHRTEHLSMLLSSPPVSLAVCICSCIHMQAIHLWTWQHFYIVLFFTWCATCVHQLWSNSRMIRLLIIIHVFKNKKKIQIWRRNENVWHEEWHKSPYFPAPNFPICLSVLLLPFISPSALTTTDSFM